MSFGVGEHYRSKSKAGEMEVQVMSTDHLGGVVVRVLRTGASGYRQGQRLEIHEQDWRLWKRIE